jgi:hypothetical protein
MFAARTPLRTSDVIVRAVIVGPHPGDQFWIDGLAQQSRMFGFPPAEAFVPTRCRPLALAVRFR